MMKRYKVYEYEVIEDINNGIFKALRHGEEWRDLIGDNFVLSLISRIEDLEDHLKFKQLQDKINKITNEDVIQVPDHVKKYKNDKHSGWHGSKMNQVWFESGGSQNE